MSRFFNSKGDGERFFIGQYATTFETAYNG